MPMAMSRIKTGPTQSSLVCGLQIIHAEIQMVEGTVWNPKVLSIDIVDRFPIDYRAARGKKTMVSQTSSLASASNE